MFNKKHNDEDEHHIKFCIECGCRNIEVCDNFNTKEPLLIWLRCSGCNISSHKFPSYLEAVHEWNFCNEKI